MDLPEGKLSTAAAGDTSAAPALLKERAGLLRRAFLAAKAVYEGGLIGSDRPERVTKSDKVVAKQLQLESLGAFAVAFEANGAVSSARFRHLVAPGFSEACGQLEVVDLKGVVGIRKSLQELTRLRSLRMVVLNESDVRDEDIELLSKISGLRHCWMTDTNLTDKCVDSLARIDRLEIVKLDGTKISDEGIERLRLLKPMIKIEGATRIAPRTDETASRRERD